ncbi:hypothetical protein V500_01278 [Pseudogymnoascus sp. VKM F-4518 (FW-2643)]|nr:hypothetical protein V500_01278 [Pseudogymnoascus sp. VKM F-4518 (FW-2643)]
MSKYNKLFKPRLQPFNLFSGDTGLSTLLPPNSITPHGISYTQHPHQRQPNNQHPAHRQAPRRPRTAKVPRFIALPRAPPVNIRFHQALVHDLLGREIGSLAVLEARSIIAVDLGFGVSAARLEGLVVAGCGGVEGREAGGFAGRVDMWELVEA